MTERSRGVTRFRMTAACAQERIRKIAATTANIVFGTHARERMAEREILDIDVLRVLRTGHVDESPEQTERGEWKAKMTLQVRGLRTVGVITIILNNGKLFVKTVEWEDLS